VDISKEISHMRKNFFDDWFTNLDPKIQALVLAIFFAVLIVIAYNQTATEDILRVLPFIYMMMTGKSLDKS
jgi:hypothetical protein